MRRQLCGRVRSPRAVIHTASNRVFCSQAAPVVLAVHSVQCLTLRAGMAWTMMKITGRCRTSEFSSHTYTKNNKEYRAIMQPLQLSLSQASNIVPDPGGHDALVLAIDPPSHPSLTDSCR